MLFETLAIQHGQILNLEYHQRRYTHALSYLKSLGKPIDDDLIYLKDIIKNIPNTDTIMRCRMDYDGADINIQFFDHIPKQIQYFKIIHADINYQYKYTNRDELNQLYNKRQNTDEVIIIKNGFVTDCTIGNLLFLKDEIWYTSDTPLLAGTQRAYLLGMGKIHLASIKECDIWQYEKVMMVNALNAFDENRAISIKSIKKFKE